MVRKNSPYDDERHGGCLDAILFDRMMYCAVTTLIKSTVQVAKGGKYGP